jgi:c-di-GMP-binding flagellar brake protein YcgR
MLESERRREKRKPLRVRVAVVIAGKRALAGRSIDVSEHGMRVGIESNLPAETTCTVSFALPLKNGSLHPMQVPAIVRHSIFSAVEGGFASGLEFNSLAPDVTEVLRRYVED